MCINFNDLLIDMNDCRLPLSAIENLTEGSKCIDRTADTPRLSTKAQLTVAGAIKYIHILINCVFIYPNLLIHCWCLPLTNLTNF
jgi:hypothetical protein